MVERNNWFGYEPEYLLKHFSEPHVLEYDFSGIDRDRIKRPPGPGVHPRVLFNGEELPEIRLRLANTRAGKQIHAAIRKHCADHFVGPAAKYAAAYASLIAGDESVDIHKDASIAYSVLYEAFRCLVDEDHEGMTQEIFSLPNMHGSPPVMVSHSTPCSESATPFANTSSSR